MNNAIKSIGLWLDKSSYPGAWIVSLDTLDASGNAETSKTLSIHDDYDGARDMAQVEAEKRGLKIIEI